MADVQCFDADPDPTFHANAYPNPKKFLQGREKKCSTISSTFFSLILQNLSCVIFIFSVTMREEGRGVRDKV